MKFVCDACGARYRIDEERVRGKVLKVRCKRCAHIITVRAPRAMESERPESAEAVEWHVAVNGVTEGPLTEAALVERFRSGSVGDEAHVWNDTFSDWKAAHDVPVFGDAMRAAKEAGNRAHVPLTQQLAAVDVVQATDDIAARVSKRLEELKADVAHTGARPAVVDEEPALDPAELSALGASLAPADDNAVPSGSDVQAEESAEPASEELSTLDDADLDEVSDLAEPEGTAPDAGEEGGDDDKAAAVIALASDAATPEAQVEESEAAASATPSPAVRPLTSGVVPIAGVVGPDTSATSAAPSASLLFQVRQAKQQRNRTILNALIVVAVLGVALFLLTRGGDEEEAPVVQQPTEAITVEATAMNAAQMELNREVAARRAVHSVARARNAALIHVPGAEPEEMDEAPPTYAGAQPTRRPGLAPPPSSTVTPRRAVRAESGGAAGAAPGTTRFGSSSNTGQRQIDTSTQSELGSYGRFAQGGAAGASVRPEVDAPERMQVGQDGPTPEHFTRGLQTFVRDSIESCAQRQMREDGSLGRARVVVRMDVQPSGSVSAVRVDREIRETAFGRCLQTRRERWRFPPYRGEMTTIERTYLVQ